MPKKITSVEMKSEAVKVPTLSIKVEPERKLPSIKPLLDTKYVVRVIQAWDPSFERSERFETFYRVLVWPDCLETMSQETNFVVTETGNPTFNKRFTFRHHGPLSTLMLSLEVVQTPRSPLQSQLPEQSNEMLHTVGTGSLPVSTALRAIPSNVNIYDGDQNVKGTIQVSIVEEPSPEK